MYLHSNVLTFDVDVLVFCIDGSSKEAAESVNPREQELSASEPSKSNVPNEPMEALLKISQDMMMEAELRKGVWTRLKSHWAL